MADIPDNLFIPAQIALDKKLYFKTKAELSNLGNSNEKAFSYYKSMIVICAEDNTYYIWDERSSDENVGLLENDFVYPAGTIENGIDYSLKRYNFFNYMEIWLKENGYSKSNEVSFPSIKYSAEIAYVSDKDGNPVYGDFVPAAFQYNEAFKPYKFQWLVYIFYSQAFKYMTIEISFYNAAGLLIGRFNDAVTFKPTSAEYVSPDFFEMPDMQRFEEYRVVTKTVVDNTTQTNTQYIQFL